MLSIYVDQPNPGSRDPFKRNGTSIDVGHTFVGISQNNTYRAVGYYPNNDSVNPFQPTMPGGLYDDAGHAYDVKIDISITPAQLNAVINKINNRPSTYDLNTYNCSNFAIEVAKAAGLNLPVTIGKWPNGAGVNPGDLGEDIRHNMPAGSMVYKTSGKAPMRSGPCM